MLQAIEVTLTAGPDHDRATMPHGVLLEGRDEEELAKSVLECLVPGILECYRPPTLSGGVHDSVIGIEKDVLQKFAGKFLWGARPGTVTILESSAFEFMVEDVLGRIHDFEEEWHLWEDEMDQAGYDPNQFPDPPELRYLDRLFAKIATEADRRRHDPRQLTFFPRERSYLGRR